MEIGSVIFFKVFGDGYTFLKGLQEFQPVLSRFVGWLCEFRESACSEVVNEIQPYFIYPPPPISINAVEYVSKQLVKDCELDENL